MTNTSLDEEYNLALKFFINKNFQKSFHIIGKLYSESAEEFSEGNILTKIFNKIVNLYLVEVGLILKDNDNIIPSVGYDQIVNDFKTDKIFNNLSKAYGSKESIPSEVLYNLCLMYNLNSTTVNIELHWILTWFENIYLILSKKGDLYSERFKELYVYEVLPKLKKVNSAEEVIKSDPYFQLNLKEAIYKLEDIKKKIQENEILEMEKKKEKEALEKAMLEKSMQKKKEMLVKNDLRYRAQQRIEDQYFKNQPVSSNSSKESKTRITRRLFSICNIIKDYTKENYQIIFIVLFSLVASVSFIRRRRINVAEKLRETLKMAFKISYL